MLNKTKLDNVYSVTYYINDHPYEGTFFLGQYDTEALALGAIHDFDLMNENQFNVYIHPRNFSVRCWWRASKLGVRDGNITIWQTQLKEPMPNALTIPPKILPQSYKGSHIWSHISHLIFAISSELDDLRRLKLHEELNGYLFAVLYEQMGDMVKMEDELTKYQVSPILDSVRDIESYVVVKDDTDGY